jgi:integrase
VQNITTQQELSRGTPQPASEFATEIDPKRLNDYAAIDAYKEYMRKKGLKPSTIEDRTDCLESVARQTEILDPDRTKTFVVESKWSDSTKAKRVDDLSGFYKFKGLRWDPPRYRKSWKPPFLPTNAEVEQLITALISLSIYGIKAATLLRLIFDTGARLGEAWQLEWTDLDFERSVVNIGKPEKNSNARQLKISSKCISLLNRLPRRSAYVFRNPFVACEKSKKDFSRTYSKQRKRVAEKLNNPRILKITFKTLRHYKATMEYARTKDILHVMKILGHRNIRNTLVYTQLVHFEEDEYVCKVASTVQEATELVENGFDFVTDVEGLKLFRKRK